MSGRMARSKGARGEREVIALLQPVIDEVCDEIGVGRIVIKRNLMQSLEGGCDIATGVAIEWVSIEVKRVESQSGLNGWWRQAVRQAGRAAEERGRPVTPVLLWRANHRPWMARMRVPIEISPGRRLKSTVTVDIQTFLAYFRERVKSELQNGR